jgi:hypothetical protein
MVDEKNRKEEFHDSRFLNPVKIKVLYPLFRETEKKPN